MRLPQAAVETMRRLQLANMPDTAVIVALEEERLPGGAVRKTGDEVDVATVPCRVALLQAATTESATREVSSSKYEVALPLALRDVIAPELEIEVISSEFSWMRRLKIDRVGTHTSGEVVVLAFCSDA